MYKYQKKILPNGARLISVPMKNSEAFTMEAMFNVGSKNETKKISGISHFLEHLFFKGTNRRPNSGDIEREFDKIGSSHNASTSQESTKYWAKAASKDAGKIIDILSDMILDPLFKEEEIEKERGVILQEINMYEDLPHEKVWIELNKAVHGDQPAGWSIAGTKKSVSGIKREDIVSYRESKYLPQNTVISVSGNFGQGEIKKIEKIFSQIKKGRANKRIKTENIQKNPQAIIINKQTDQSHLAASIRGFNRFDQKRFPLNLLSIIAGGNSSSRLYTEVRQKRGLAYYIGSSTDLQDDYGSFDVSAGVGHDRFSEAVSVIINVLKDLRKNGVTEEELKNAKSFLRGQLSLRLETTDQVSGFYGEQELFYRKITQPEEILKKIEKVTRNDILKVAREIIRPKNISIGAIGPYKNGQKMEKDLKNMLAKI